MTLLHAVAVAAIQCFTIVYGYILMIFRVHAGKHDKNCNTCAQFYLLSAVARSFPVRITFLYQPKQSRSVIFLCCVGLLQQCLETVDITKKSFFLQSDVSTFPAVNLI